MQKRWSLERLRKPKLGEWLVLSRELNIDCDAASIFLLVLVKEAKGYILTLLGEVGRGAVWRS